MADLGLGLDGGQLNEIPPNATREVQIATLNDIVRRLNGLLKTQSFSDATNKRFLQGFQEGGWAGGDFGMKISLPGVDVLTARDDQLLFSWDWTTNTQIDYSDGVPRILKGTAPGDGRTGFWVSKLGQDVKHMLGG